MGMIPNRLIRWFLDSGKCGWDSVPDTIAHILLWDTIGGIVIYTTLDLFRLPLHDSLFLKKYAGNVVQKGSALPLDSIWKRVMIPILDTAFFKHRFFNFDLKNYAPLV